jgi:hypothetical protein
MTRRASSRKSSAYGSGVSHSEKCPPRGNII